MNKAKIPLSVLAILYLSVSVIIHFGVIIYEISRNSGFFNIWPILNYLGSLIPFVLILVYSFVFSDCRFGKILLMGIVSFKAAFFLGNVTRLLQNLIKYIKNDAFTQFLKLNVSSIVIDLGGITVFVLLLLYILKVIKNKIAVLIISYSYFTVSFLTTFRDLAINIPSYLVFGSEKYMMYLSAIGYCDIILAGLSLAIWIIFTKTIILRD